MQNPSYYAIIPANVRYDNELSPNAKLLYGEITALCNVEGFCWASNAYFAELYNMSTRQISRLISQLNDKGYITVEIANESDRRIYIHKGPSVSTHDKNVQPPMTNLSRGHDKNVQPPHDKNVLHNNTSINTTINNTKNNNKHTSISEEMLKKEFEQLWSIYPRKLGKKKAFDSFKKARKVKKISYEIIKNGLYKYLRYLEQTETEERYIQHGSTWFNQEKWQDEYVISAQMKKPKNSTEYLKLKYGGELYEPYRNGEIIEYDSEVIPEFF